MSYVTAKRPAPRIPDGPPMKRRATSSPEEGELDDSAEESPSHAGPSVTTPPADAVQKFRVPFPFKNKNKDSLLSRIEDPPRPPHDRCDYSRESGRGRDRDERSQKRPSAAMCDGYDLEDRLVLPESAVYSRDGRLRGVGLSIRDAAGDHYKPVYALDSRNSHYSERGRDRDYDRNYVEREGQVTSRHEVDARDHRPSQSPGRPDSPGTDSRDRSLSRSASPQGAVRNKPRHRLPTPHSTSLALSPRDDPFYDRAGYAKDHYDPYIEPYSRETYRDRLLDPRGQYHREELDDYDDRHYRPTSRDRSSLHRSRTPFRPTTPHGDADVVPVPDADLPPSPPSLLPAPPKTGKDASIEQELRAHQAVSFALRRPGAPHGQRSPPSSACVQKLTPIPPVADTAQPSKETPVPVATKSKRPPIKRTREQEKAAYQRIFAGCGERDDYDVTTKLGEGTFGLVA